jgi:hypothetical protein
MNRNNHHRVDSIVGVPLGSAMGARPATSRSAHGPDAVHEGFVRLPGLLRQWELAQFIIPGNDIIVEEVGATADGIPLFAAYRRERAAPTAARCTSCGKSLATNATEGLRIRSSQLEVLVGGALLATFICSHPECRKLNSFPIGTQ